MRTLSAALAAGLCLIMAMLVACSPAKPPVGRWEGTYASGDTMIAARLEIDKDGAIYVSAPDALNVATNDEDQREIIRQRLAMGLADAWAHVLPRKLDFDGKVFRNPGHIAPQAEWDADTKTMTLIVYPGTRPSIRIKLRPVREFSADPWPG